MLGQALCKEFSDQEPVCWDREELDITDQNAVASTIASQQPDVIINAAAFTDVDASEEKPELARLLNASAVQYLAEAANKCDAVLVQYSTSYVFSGNNTIGYEENARPDPVSVYGQTKLEGENEAAKAAKYYIIRLDRLFGDAGSGKKSFVEKVIEAAKEKGKLKVIDGEAGGPTYAPDLAGLTRKLIDQKLPYGIYHGTNSGVCTWYEFAKEIFKISGIKVELTPVNPSEFPRKAARPDYATLINTKLPEQRSWQEALKEFLTK